MSIDAALRKENPGQIQSSCQTSVEGAACSPSCACKTASAPTLISLEHSSKPGTRSNRWHEIRSMVMVGIACLTSPCCTPLIVPVLLSLLAGTPLAVWLGANIGWVYGGLTLLSVVSLVMALRWSKTAPRLRR
jgi:hypothetical protein